jgi:UDP-N-acetylglucosamine 1-carboxyvinyltransferase
MEKIVVTGGRPLSGSVRISGAKNAALPLLAAALLTDKELRFANVPDLSDIQQMLALLDGHGASFTYDPAEKTCSLRAASIKSEIAPYDIVRKMRASILVLGPLLARHGKAVVSLPGGCAIGTRPVNVHIDGLRALGAEITIENGFICAQTSGKRLQGADIQIPLVSVTGTENLLMAATLAQGQTILRNVAKEPEVCDLAHCLVAMGARIDGIGTDILTIDGVDDLHGTEYTVIPDRIEAATYAVGAIITQGDLVLENVIFEDLAIFWDRLGSAGAMVEQLPAGNGDGGLGSVRVKMDPDAKGIKEVDIIKGPYPGFPTDIQAQFMALMTLCSGASMITETIFENRFMHVLELCRMGANITIHHASALVRGVKQLMGTNVMATDIRASVSLVLAGLAAQDTTQIHRIYHIDRGYEQIEKKLQQCGAIIERAAA